METLTIKLKRFHPANKMRLGSHVITHAPKSYELNKEEIAELKSKGGQHWFLIVESKPAKTKPAKPATKPAKEK